MRGTWWRRARGSFSISNITTFPRQWRRRCTKRAQTRGKHVDRACLRQRQELHAAVDSARATNPAADRVGVTVLTSLDENDLEKIGIRDTVQDEVYASAALALANGCQGI